MNHISKENGRDSISERRDLHQLSSSISKTAISEKNTLTSANSQRPCSFCPPINRDPQRRNDSDDQDNFDGCMG